MEEGDDDGMHHRRNKDREITKAVAPRTSRGECSDTIFFPVSLGVRSDVEIVNNIYNRHDPIV